MFPIFHYEDKSLKKKKRQTRSSNESEIIKYNEEQEGRKEDDRACRIQNMCDESPQEGKI